MAYDYNNHKGLKIDALVLDEEKASIIGGKIVAEEEVHLKKSAKKISSLLGDNNTEHTVVKNIVTHDDKQIIVSRKNTSFFSSEYLLDKGHLCENSKNSINDKIDLSLLREAVEHNKPIFEVKNSIQIDPYKMNIDDNEIEEFDQEDEGIDHKEIIGSNIPPDPDQITQDYFNEEHSLAVNENVHDQIVGSNNPVDELSISNHEFSEKQMYKFSKTGLDLENFGPAEDLGAKENFSVARLADVTIVKVNIVKCILPVAIELKDTLDKEISESMSDLILDLTKVRVLDSACLGAIFFMRKKVEKINGSISLVTSKETKLPLLFIHGVEKYFKLFYNIDHAISFYSKKNIAS